MRDEPCDTNTTAACPSPLANSEKISCNKKTECIYRAKPAAFVDARRLIEEYIWFCNNESIQLKTEEAPLMRRLSA